MKFIFLAVMIGLFITPGKSLALDRQSAFFVQLRLNELGYDAGGQDGIIGPRTRAAVASYARERGVNATAKDVMHHMIRSSLRSRMPANLTDEERKELERTISIELRDPSSAIFRDEIFRICEGGSCYYCGEVNAKNLFGAYVGFRTFQVMRVANIWALLGVDSEPSGLLWYYCNMRGFD